jgi:hypothetical protein
VPALVVRDGPLTGRRFRLGTTDTVIGREGATIAIDDPELSRRHAVVRLVAGRIELEDLDSLNGTFVNGERVTGSRTLAGGDSLKLGTTTFAVEAPTPSAATVVSPRPGTPETRIARAPAAPAAAAAPPAVERQAAPSEPFGHYAEEPAGRRRVASRLVTPQLFTTACIVGTAVALVIYFAQH